MSTSALTLPPEIWLQITKWVRLNAMLVPIPDFTTLKNLSVVSSTFRGVAQPELFMSLNIDMHMVDYLVISIRVDGLLDLLKNRPESAYWPKTFSCLGRGKHADRSALWHRVLSLFIQLESLTHIGLLDFPITLSMISHVHGLPDLRHLHVDTNVSLALEVQTSEEADVHPPLPVVPPFFDHQENAVPLSAPARLITAPTIRSLSLHGPDSVQTILKVVYAHPTFKFSHVSSLSSSDDFGAHSPFDYPELFSNLIHLRLIYYDPAVFSPSGLRNLQEFEGHPSTAALIVPGRPMKKLTIFGDNPTPLSKEILSSISSGSVQLLRLAVYTATWRDGCLRDIAELLPGLTFLALHSIDGDYMVWLEERLCAELRGLSALRTFHITPRDYLGGNDPSEERQKAMLNGLKPSAASLREVQIGRRVWRRDDLSSWTPMSAFCPNSREEF